MTRAVAIPDTLAAADGRPLSVSELACTLGLPKCRYLSTVDQLRDSCELCRRSAHIAGETARAEKVSVGGLRQFTEPREPRRDCRSC